MPCNKIMSLTNPRVKALVRLRDRKERRTTGLTIVEGQRELSRALEAGVPFKAIYFGRGVFEGSARKGIAEKATGEGNPLFRQLIAMEVPVYETTPEVFAKISYGNYGEGILAVCEPRAIHPGDLPVRLRGLYVVVESVEKPGNLGAILRTCDGAGVDGVFLCDEKTDVTNPNVIRASLGTVFSVPTVVSTNTQAMEFFRSRGISVYATLPQAAKVYSDVAFTGPVALVLGSEHQGLNDFWIRQAEKHIKIPMRGRADSLNVSAAAAIILYEIIRQRSR